MARVMQGMDTGLMFREAGPFFFSLKVCQLRETLRGFYSFTFKFPEGALEARSSAPFTATG